ISIDEYTEKLKVLYNLNHLKSSFRSLVSPFSRIWNKGALDPEQPFSGDVKESAGVAIGRLIDFFEYTEEIAEEKSTLDEFNEKKKLISKSMNAQIIPKINKTKYKENQKTITENTDAIKALKQGFTGALSAYEALFDEQLRKLQQQKNELASQKNDVLIKIERINRDISGVTPRLTANISLIKEFFPNVDAKRLEQVESFHQNITKIVHRELKRDLDLYSDRLLEINAAIINLENKIRTGLASKGTPDDLFMRVFELKELVDKAAEENSFYDKKVAFDKDVLLSKERLEAIYIGIFINIEA
ncbi:chromosome partitioning protein ParA, partial [Citrobacter braakii]